METVASLVCPACSFEQDDGVETCQRCGVIFAKVKVDDRPRRPSFSTPVPTGNAWKLLAAGLVAAAVALDLKIWTGLSLDIEQVAGVLLAFSLIPVALVVLAFVFRERVNAFARSLLLLDP